MDNKLKIGSVVKFNSLKTTGFPTKDLKDITIGKAYKILGIDSDGDVYFEDDAGEQDYAAASDVETIDMTVVSY